MVSFTRMIVLAFAMVVGMVSAFQPTLFTGARMSSVAAARTNTLSMTDTYWEGKAPPSKVLGPYLEKVPSKLLGVISLGMLAAGTFSIHEYNILHTVTPEAIDVKYVLGVGLTPVSWGMHVASWIQKQNGK